MSDTVIEEVLKDALASRIWKQETNEERIKEHRRIVNEAQALVTQALEERAEIEAELERITIRKQAAIADEHNETA